MDDFLPDTLKNSISEYCQRIISILTPEIFIGFQGILNESYQICVSNNEKNKYLMTFQNCIRRIPKYSQTIIEKECNRIIEKSGCNYLEDLLTVTHVILLKNLTTIRVGNRQKKIDISIPKLDMFIHKIYINVGRKLYQNVDLFIIELSPIQKMKNRRIIENLIEKCILDTIRDSMPYEHIIRSYLDETEEHEEEEFEENSFDNETLPPLSSLNDIPEDKPFNGNIITDINKDKPLVTKVSFKTNDISYNDNDKPLSILKTSQPIRKLSECITNQTNNEIQNDNGNIKLLDDDDDDDIHLDIFNLNESINKLPNANTPFLQNEQLVIDNFNLNEVSLDAL